jgi:SulP family sulfate permease
MGIIQFVFGALKLGKLIKLVSPSVMTGFVNGLALVIFLAQLEQLKSNGLWLQSYELASMLGLIAITIFGVYIAPKITRHIPASLFGIVLVTVFVMIFGIDAKTVGDIAHISGNLPTLHIPNIPWTLETLWIVAPYSFILAAVGLIETLLTANLVDDFVQNHKTQPNKESIAQGIGNILTGLFGGMGGCAMIGQTVINLKAGGTHRLAGVVEALSILAYIVFASAVIESIPIAALVGVMCMVCYYTFDWTSFKIIDKPKQDVAIIVIVTTVTVLLNLAYAVILGIILTYIFQKFEKESL